MTLDSNIFMKFIFEKFVDRLLYTYSTLSHLKMDQSGKSGSGHFRRISGISK